MADVKWFNKTYIIIIATILFFPFGITLILINKRYSIQARVLSSFIIFVVFVSAIMSEPNLNTVQNDTPQQPQQTKKWYEGGTLHQATIGEWHKASYENKLATSADFIAKMWKDKSFKPEIQSQISSLDDVRILADEMVVFIDTATTPEEGQNPQVFLNQKVSDLAAMGLILMRWVK